MAANALNQLAKGAVGLGAGISLLQSAMYDVDGGHRAVMFDRISGVKVRTPSPAREACKNVLLTKGPACLQRGR